MTNDFEDKDKRAGKYDAGENLTNAATATSQDDDAMVPTLEEPRNLSEEELLLEKKLVRKIDLRLMPCLVLVSAEDLSWG